MKRGFKHVLVGIAAFIVTAASFLVSASACIHMAHETDVPNCLK